MSPNAVRAYTAFESPRLSSNARICYQICHRRVMRERAVALRRAMNVRCAPTRTRVRCGENPLPDGLSSASSGTLAALTAGEASDANSRYNSIVT
jgi:hypothetical protein